MEIKDSANIAEKWSRVTPQRTQDFQNGIETTPKDWATNTGKAEGSYKEGVTAAVNRGAFGKGVRSAGTAKWKQRSLELGTTRWGTGVAASGSSFQQGFEPYRAILASP